MKKIIHLFIIYTIITSCIDEKKHVNFHISNSNYNHIADVKVSNGVNDILIDTIMPNMTKSITLNFRGVPKVDGGYSLSYTLNSEKLVKNFGYYSNGVPSTSEFEIYILQDTIQIKEVFKK